ncbi:MAG TPA: zinc ABC transporter substrate-binding protein [Candidatus Kapabacteria bacterium]|nr:zinc ABC transporter substrate-binding protein [Candidatus Kapabacteria bacterium]
MKKIVGIVVGSIALGGILWYVAWNKTPHTAPPSEERKMQVVASIYPIAFFAQEIGREHVDVRTLTPAGAEPHDYEPTPVDLVALQSADIVLLNGAGLEPWADHGTENTRRVVEMVAFVEPLPVSYQEEEEHHDEGHEEDAEEGHVHEEGEVDPHFWLDPIQAKKMVHAIADALIAIDSDHTADYIANREHLLIRLDRWHDSYGSNLKECKQRTIIVSHNAFQYLGKRYGIDIHAIAGISPDEEPSPRRMADITQLAREKKVTHIFFETLVSPKLAQTIANETGLGTLTLNPLEGLTKEEMDRGDNFFTVMGSNLNALQTAMVCQ